MAKGPRVSAILGSLCSEHYSDRAPGTRFIVVFYLASHGYAVSVEGEAGAEFTPPGDEDPVMAYGFDVIGPVGESVQEASIISLAESLVECPVVVREFRDWRPRGLVVNPTVGDWEADIRRRAQG